MAEEEGLGRGGYPHLIIQSKTYLRCSVAYCANCVRCTWSEELSAISVLFWQDQVDGYTQKVDFTIVVISS